MLLPIYDLEWFIRETGMSNLREIAEYIGLSENTVRSWSCGRNKIPSIQNQQKIYDAAEKHKQQQQQQRRNRFNPRPPTGAIPGSGQGIGDYR